MSSEKRINAREGRDKNSSLSYAAYTSHASTHYSSRRKFTHTVPLLAKPKKGGVFAPEGYPYACLILFVTCIFCVAGYFTRDSIVVVEKDIEQSFGISAASYGLLYSVYSLPNCVLPFFAGYLLDKFGLRLGALVSCFFVLMGAVVVAGAPYINAFYVMLIGRFLFGMGAESSYVCQDTIVQFWFHDKMLALAIALSMSASRMGSFLTLSINAQVVEHYHSWKAALWLGVIFSALAFIAAIIYCGFDLLAQKISSRKVEMEAENPGSLKDILKFPRVFWPMAIVLTLFYAVIFPFQSAAVQIFVDKYGFSTVNAGRYASLLPLTSLFTSPLFGIIVDKTGKRIWITLVGLVVLIGGFLVLALTSSKIFIIPGIVCVGIGYAIVPAAVWPVAPLIVDSSILGTANGLLSSLVNAGMCVAYYVEGYISDIPDYTFYDFLFFIGTSGLAVLVGLLWLVWDIRDGGKCEVKLSDKIKPVQVYPDIMSVNSEK